jgi:type I restriction enzyme S subunit
MKWETVQIGQLGEVITGNTPPRKSPELYGNYIPFIKPTDMEIDRRYTSNPEECYSELGFEKYRKSLIPKGATCVVTIGSIGKKMTQAYCDCFINQAVNAVIPNKEYDNDFVFYLFKNNLDKVKGLDSGTSSGRENVSKSAFSSIEVKVIKHLPTQRKIASILSAYDDLIENNLKRIKLLEDKARIEFKSIQKNEKLEIKKAVEVLQFTTGKLNSNAAIKNGLYPFFTCGQEILRTNTFSVDEEVVLLGGNNASAIYPVFYYKGKFDAYQRTYIIKPKPEINISFKYLYFFWEDKLDYLKNISTGAATKFLTLKILNDIDVPLPNKKIMDGYEKLTDPIFKLIAILVEQNTKLREARDILLPKLMNGQIEVS